MCALSKPLDGSKVDRSRVIALWKDPFESSPREIELPEEHGAVVLSLSIHVSEEWTADGRSSDAGFTRLTGVYPLPLASPTRARRMQSASLKRGSRARVRKS
jgi:hypothetical protein